MRYEHAIELLTNVVDYVSAMENTATQIDILQRCYGFTNEDLSTFGYSEEDIKTWGESAEK